MRRNFLNHLSVIALVIAVCVFSTLPVATANPFETIAKNHWVYNALREFNGRVLGRNYVEDRVRLGESITHFDLALWVGDTLSVLSQIAGSQRKTGSVGPPTLAEMIDAFNRANPDQRIDERMATALREMIVLSRTHLEVLGFATPPDVASDGGEAKLSGFAALFQDFRLRGESRLRLVDIDETGPAESDVEHGVSLQQDYRLQISTPVSETVRLGAEVEGGANLWALDRMLDLTSASVDIGVQQSAIARIGTVSGHGLSELAVGGVGALSGLRAGIRLGQLGSTLLVGTYGNASQEASEEDAAGGTVAAWDTTLKVSDRLNLGATLAHREAPLGDSSTEAENTVIRLGGSYSVSPQLIVSGEMAKSSGDEGGGEAVKVGAVLHPLPELTLGAFLLSSGSGYRALFGDDEGRSSRLDLSAEIGRWILSVRRQNVYRDSGSSEEELRSVTRLALEFPIAENAVAAASHELGKEGDGGGESEVKTALDLEVRFDKGKVSLGYVLEDIRSATKGATGTVRTAKASLEHAVGPIGKATAGFSIVDQEQGSETSSNVGLVYEFDNASVSLKYEIVNKPGEVKKNVTTAEVAIKF